VGAHISNFDIPLLLVISQKVIPDVYVLSAAVFSAIIRHADCTLIITYERDFAQFVAIVPMVCLIQSNCAQQWPAAMYSTSAVERATEFCFFESHDTKDLPRN
jgi:hypothetical protein